MVKITLGNLEQNPELLYQFIKDNIRPMIQHCVYEFGKINEVDAEYLFENAFLKLSEIVIQEKVRKKDVPVINWMYQELTRKCIDFMRSKEGNVITGEEGDKIISILPCPASNIEYEVIQKETHQFLYPFLRECIETRMKGRRREIFQLYLEGYIAAEIAQKLGVTRAFVSKETKIGCRLLRQWLEQRGFD